MFSTLYALGFRDDHPKLHMKTMVDIIWNAHKNNPEDHTRKLSIFLDNAGILDKTEPTFGHDVEILSDQLKLWAIGNEEVTILTVIKEDICGIDKDTWQRFENGVQSFHHLSLALWPEEMFPQ